MKPLFVSSKTEKSLSFPPPRAQRLIRKGVCFPLPAPHNPVLSKPRQGFSIFFLFFVCAYHNFCYSVSTTIALRGASLTPKARINLLWQQGKREGNKHFSQKLQDWQPAPENAENTDFFFSPFCIPEFSVFSLILSLSQHQTTCPITAPFPLSKASVKLQ